MKHHLQQYAGCLFCMAQLVPPGGPAWQCIDQALSWQGLAAALPSLLEGAAEGLVALFSAGGEFAVGHTPEAHAGWVLLAAAALEGRLRGLLAVLQLEKQQAGGGVGMLGQAEAEQLCEDLEHASDVATALGTAGSGAGLFSFSGHTPQPRLPQMRLVQLRVLSAGAALLSLSGDASSSSSQAGASWDALGASSGGEEAAAAAGRWTQLLLELRQAFNRNVSQPPVPCNQASWQ